VYKVDDAVTLKAWIQEVTTEIAFNEKLPYLQFYKKCSEIGIFRDRIDMLMDWYGRVKERKIALALTLSTGGTYIEKSNGANKTPIRKLQETKIQNVNEFREFIINFASLHYWIYHDEYI